MTLAGYLTSNPARYRLEWLYISASLPTVEGSTLGARQAHASALARLLELFLPATSVGRVHGRDSGRLWSAAYTL